MNDSDPPPSALRSAERHLLLSQILATLDEQSRRGESAEIPAAEAERLEDERGKVLAMVRAESVQIRRELRELALRLREIEAEAAWLLALDLGSAHIRARGEDAPG